MTPLERIQDALARYNMAASRLCTIAGVHNAAVSRIIEGRKPLPQTVRSILAAIDKLDAGKIKPPKSISWTAQDDANLRALWNEGIRDDVEIGKRLGRTRGAVKSRRSFLDLCYTEAEISAIRSRGIRLVTPFRDWTADDDAKLAEMYARGISTETMARHLNRSKSAVNNRILLTIPPEARPKMLAVAAKEATLPTPGLGDETAIRLAARVGSQRLAKAVSKLAAPVPAKPRRRTFEELLAAVEAGEVRVIERVPIRAPEYHRTMGGVVGDYSI